MNIRDAAVAAATLAATVTVGAGVASADGGGGTSICSMSGREYVADTWIIDTVGHAIVVPMVRESDGFSGDGNPGVGFLSPYYGEYEGQGMSVECKPDGR